MKRNAAKRVAVNLPFDVVESKLHIRPQAWCRLREQLLVSNWCHRLLGRCGHRTRHKLWEDDALGAVGRSRQARLRMGLDRRARQR